MTKTQNLMGRGGVGTVPREVHFHIENIDDFRGMAGFPILLLAANPHLTAPEIWEVLYNEHSDANRCERPQRWIHRMRWMFKRPGTNHPSSRGNIDGRDAQAIAVMRQHPEMSLRDLSKLLETHRIKRSREWLRRHRCD